MDWTGGLDWWTGLKIIFMLTDENSLVELVAFADIATPSQTLARIIKN